MIELLTAIYDIFIEIAPYMLLGLFFVGLLHIFFSKEFVIKHVGKNNIASVVKASVLGVPLPLCSCGVIPTAVYMAKNGASKGAVISFLISTPQTGLDSIMVTYGMLGWIFAIYRPVVAFLSGIIGGIIVNVFSKEELNITTETSDAPSCSSSSCSDTSCSSEKPKEESKLSKFYNYAFVEFLDDIAVHFFIGIIISGLISYFIPDSFFVEYSIGSGLLGMLVMIVIGLPMYVCATASIPIAITLMMKGVSPGAAFVFLAVGPMTNAASLTILAKILTKKILAVYVVSSSIIAIIAGYSLDLLVSVFDLKEQILPSMAMDHDHSSEIVMIIYNVSSVIFAFMLAGSLYRKLIKPKLNKPETNPKENDMNTLKLNIEGMSCNHCVNNIKDTLLKLKNISKVDIDLSSGKAEIEGDHLDKKSIKDLIDNLGYKVV